YGVFALNALVDLYCYFSLLEYLANGTWLRWYGYSPFPFLMAACFGLMRPRTYDAFFEFIDRARLAERTAKLQRKLAIVNAVLVLLVLCVTFYRMNMTASIQFNGVRTLVQLNGTYNYYNDVDQLSVGANWLYSQLDCDSDDCDSDSWSGNLYTCTQSDTLIDPTVANSSSLVCFLRHPQLNQFFSAWGIFILLALFAAMIGGAVPGADEAYIFPAAVFLFFVVVEWFVCQYLDFGTVYPYSLSQSATWFRTMGPYPADKVAGYGMVPGAWD
ncbi:hypothetical protein HK405_001201, partial [Cladochytrium tenue]